MSADRLPVNQARLFQSLRWNLWRNATRLALAHSMVRPITILLSSLFVAVFVFVVSYLGLRFMAITFRLRPDEQIGGMLLGVLFFTLGGALIFSTALILNGSLFNTQETAFLLSGPSAEDQVFAYKFQSAVTFSSWAFLLLGGPVLIAYGLVVEAPWYFYPLLPLFFLGFVLLPGAMGGLCCLLIVNYMPRRRKQFVILAIVVATVWSGWYIYRTIAQSKELAQSPEPMGETAGALLGRISFTRNLWLPSAWVSRGLQAAGHGDIAETVWYLALIWSNGLFAYLVAAWASRKLYRRGLNRLSTGGDLRRKHGGLWLDRILSALMPFVHPGTRLLIVKDFRTFRRDPQQWAQVAIFVGLLVLYFGNIRRLFLSDDIPWAYQNSLSMLNLGSIALLLCTYTGRFIYPLLSLEGRKFWILGLLPLQREQLLWGKFIFSLMGGLVLSLAMMLLSDCMLGMPIGVILIHQVTAVVLAAGLSGISVGLGAIMPNFRESDPSKIAVGFGGTLNLVAGLGFLLVTLLVMAGPWHIFMAFRASGEEPAPMVMWPVVGLGLVGGLVLGFLAVLLPLRAGNRALRQMEF